MPIDTSVINNLRPVQLPDVAKQFAEAQSLGQERQIRQQQMQMNQQKIQQEQRANKLADEEAVDTEKAKQAYSMAGGDPDKTIQHMIKLGVGPKTVQSTQQHFADYQKKLADTKAAELPTIKYRDEQMLGLHDQAIQLATADPQKYAAQYPQLYAAAVKLDPDAAKHLDPNVPPTVDQLKTSALGYNTHLTFLGQEEEKRKQEAAKAAASEEARKAAIAPSLLRKATADATIAESDSALKQFELDAAKATPDQQAAKVGATIDQAKYPEIYKRTLANVNAGVTHQEKMSALHAGSAEVAEREKETDPAIRNARVATAVATENALTPGMVRRAVDTEVAKAKLAPESFSSIPDPRARAAAEADYSKDSKEYADKVAAASQLRDFVHAAQSGNKAAPGLIPIAEVRQLVNRVNRQELQSVSSSAGSAWDRLQGKIGSLTDGEPIPPEVLKDTETISRVMEDAAKRGYHMKVEVNNKTHGGNVKPIEFTSTAATVPSKQKVTTQAQYDALSSGSTYTGEDGKKYKKP